MNRLLGCLCVAAVAWWFAAALNVPVWRDWEPGDRTDIAVTAFIAAMNLSRPRKQPASTEPDA